MPPRIVTGYSLHERLKEAGANDPKPAWLVAKDGDGGEVKISVTEARNKWARVMLALREVSWVTCDVFDKKGGLVFRHQRNQDDRETMSSAIEDIVPTRAMSELAGLMNVVSTYVDKNNHSMLRAQEMVLSHHHEQMREKDASLMQIVQLTLQRFEQAEERAEEAMRLNHQLSADLVNAQLAQLQLVAGPPQVDEDGNEKHSDRSASMMEAMIMRRMFGGGDSQRGPTPKTETPKTETPKNGHAKNGVKKQDQPARPESSTTPPTE
jgi:hypothetical protein